MEMAILKQPCLKRKTKNSSADMVSDQRPSSRKKLKLSGNAVWETEHSYCYNPSKPNNETEWNRETKIRKWKVKKGQRISWDGFHEYSVYHRTWHSMSEVYRLPSFEIVDALAEYLLEQADFNFPLISSNKQAGPKRKLSFHQVVFWMVK